uniref:Uncharacterized protein n=1 Tax=Myotis myotis TaxID=51298 RepID=A0A7J7UD23_MYOMY|nr:hypothetical protein mMyoMyo1_008771 [Myotis myotis]
MKGNIWDLYQMRRQASRLACVSGKFSYSQATPLIYCHCQPGSCGCLPLRAPAHNWEDTVCYGLSAQPQVQYPGGKTSFEKVSTLPRVQGIHLGLVQAAAGLVHVLLASMKRSFVISLVVCILRPLELFPKGRVWCVCVCVSLCPQRCSAYGTFLF